MQPATARLGRDLLLVGVLGLAAGLVANAVSPRGLSLTRDYFPAAPPAVAPERPPAAAAPTAPTASPALDSARPARTKRGLPRLSHDQVVALFHDPRYASGLVVFVDARDAAHYAAGHIPGAYLFDHYHPERYVATVLGATSIAERVVVYCNGGDCEDSELAALDLQSLGVAPEKIAIYGGGITAWQQRHLPMEAGARGGGKRVTS